VEGLDDENVAMISQLITLLSQQTNIAILYVSHRIEPNIIPNAIFELIPLQKLRRNNKKISKIFWIN
jgi:molybdate transport system ATP-binding protein